MIRFIDIFLNLILGFLSYVVPKNKNQILLGADNGNEFFGNPKYFYLFLLQNKKYFNKILWITKNDKIYHDLKKEGFPVLKLYSLKGFIAIIQSNFLITSHFINDVSYFFFLPGKFNKIETFHGNAIKVILEPTHIKKTLNNRIGGILVRKEQESYRLVLTPSEETSKLFTRHYKNVKILGYPRNDVLFDDSLIFKNYEQELNLKQYAKIFLYCPTFRDKPQSKVPFTKNFLYELNDYLTNNNYLFLIKNHYWGKINVNVKNYSNIMDVSKMVSDVQDLLIKIDILITDYSSVVLDFILLDKPIIFYTYDLQEYITTCRKLNYSYGDDSILSGPFVKNENELFACLKSINIIFNDRKYQEKYKKCKEHFNYYLDGKSCHRLLDYLINLR